MNEATVLLLDHNRNEIMVRNDAFLVETTLMARIDCKRLSSVNVLPILRWQDGSFTTLLVGPGALV
jgi:hypothetical protein